MTKLYLAYGSNMNRAQMARRCPKARALRAIVIDDARLVFRGVADIEHCAGASVPVVLWEITADCERSLDKFEGVAGGVYEKKLIPLDNGEQALTYVMCSNGIAPPTREYYERIKQGYADFKIDPEPLDVALKHSHVKQAHSPETRRRMVRNIAQGNTVTARRPMHVPLSAIDPETGRSNAPERFAGRGESGLCKHGWLKAQCEECNPNDGLTLPEALRRPVARPLEGYNYSKEARANSKANSQQPRSKAGQPKGRKVQTNGHDFESESPATRSAVRYNGGKRSNTRVTKKRQNLTDYLKDKGYT